MQSDTWHSTGNSPLGLPEPVARRVALMMMMRGDALSQHLDDACGKSPRAGGPGQAGG